MDSSFTQSVYSLIVDAGEISLDQLVVGLYGGSLIADSQMAQLDAALSILSEQGKIERDFLGIRIKK